MRDRQMCANTSAGTDSREIPRFLVQFDFEPLPFQSGMMMASVQSAGIEQRSQTRVKSVRSQVTIAIPPYLRSSALIPQMHGARLFFSFLIDVGGPVSMVALGTALAASVCRRISGVGVVLLNCSTKCSFHLCSCSLGSLSWSPSLLTTWGS